MSHFTVYLPQDESQCHHKKKRRISFFKIELHTYHHHQTSKLVKKTYLLVFFSFHFCNRNLLRRRNKYKRLKAKVDTSFFLKRDIGSSKMKQHRNYEFIHQLIVPLCLRLLPFQNSSFSNTRTKSETSHYEANCQVLN